MSSQVFVKEPRAQSPSIRSESGYASGASSQDSLPEVYFSKPHLKFLNAQLQKLEPQDILKWCITSLPGLSQTTAFGLTGLVTLDMLSKMDGPYKHNTDMIFLDTLFHFDETYALVDRIRKRYNIPVHIYKPAGCETVEDFNVRYGEKLWETNEDHYDYNVVVVVLEKLWETNEDHYDYVAKVEPAERAYSELQVKAALTGRRRSQGGKRGDLDIIEVNEGGLIKINPLANWSFAQVKEYIDANDVPYNELLNRGYKSVGDWHSTQPVAAGEDERSGRWKGRNKTECGIHNPKSKYAQFLKEQELKAQQDALNGALQKLAV